MSEAQRTRCDKKETLNRVIKYVIYAALIAFMILLDRSTKWFIANASGVSATNPLEVIPGFFYISNVRNTGAAWGIFSSNTFALSVVTIIATLLVCFLIFESDNVLVGISLSLIAAGAVGNVIDRLTTGKVIDFLRFILFGGYEFPSFNVADICITVGSFGLIILIIISIFNKKLAIFRTNSLAHKFFYTDEKKKENQSVQNESVK